MKTILLIFSSFIGLGAYSQCFTFYGDPAPCPTSQDSFEIYQNALKVYQFYAQNKSYKNIKTKKIKTDADKKLVHEKMLTARQMYFILRKDKRTNVQTGLQKSSMNIGYKDIPYNQYFNHISNHRFRQRDLENQIINGESPFPLYDNRIAPVLINEYKCLDSNSHFFGDIVHIPLYFPVVVKPVSMLSAVERAERNKFLEITVEKSQVKVESPVNKTNPKPLSTEVRNKGVPVYYYNGYGSGSIVGFLHQKTLHRICKSEYSSYAMPKFARELLENETELQRWVKNQFGEKIELDQR
jgi:hypothetical protein